MRTKSTTLPLGTISEGTLRPEDLIDAYVSALADVRLSSAERSELRLIQAHIARDYDYPSTEDWDADEARSWDVEALTTILENHCPDYSYFGTLEGDGACFGVWPSIDSLEEDARFNTTVRKVNAGDQFPTFCKYATLNPEHVMSVTDHGNVTLYRRAGNRWIEVWSVV